MAVVAALAGGVTWWELPGGIRVTSDKQPSFHEVLEEETEHWSSSTLSSGNTYGHTADSTVVRVLYDDGISCRCLCSESASSTQPVQLLQRGGQITPYNY